MLNPNHENQDDNETFTLNKMEDEDSVTRKSDHVKNQVLVWDKILECRIKYNKVLLNCDKLETESLDLENEEVSNLKSNTQLLLDRLVEVQNEFYKSNPKLREITKEKSKNYKKTLIENFDKFKVYRNQILNKWENRVKLFSLNNQTVTAEVDILTKINTFTKKHQSDDNQKLNTFLKNDQEFYGTLIKEFIERKGANLNLAKQIKNNKVKKQVDTKCTKGRKIRYQTHKKLVNFTSSSNSTALTTYNTDVLYKSLFL